MFDEDNLVWSDIEIIASISIELWEVIKKDLGYDATGPEVFNAVVRKQQQVNASSGPALVVTKQNGLDLEPVQDVEVFGSQITERAGQIEGTGFAPMDLSVLVPITFLNIEALKFQLKASALNDKVEDNPLSHM
jgi:hypothetical protein